MPHKPPKVKPPKSNKPPRLSFCKRGYDARHTKLRQVYLAAHPICERCQRSFSTELDHIDGDNQNISEENLAGLCARCHGIKTAENMRKYGHG